MSSKKFPALISMKYLLHAEQNRNHGTRTYSQESSYTEARDIYRPLPNVSPFEVPAFHIPVDKVNLYFAKPDEELCSKFVSKDRVTFCVHPQVLDERPHDPVIQTMQKVSKVGQAILVSPTASTRSVVCVDDSSIFPYGLKLHFPFKISRFRRRVLDHHVKLGTLVTAEIQKGIDQGMFNPGFAILRDTIGVSLKSPTADERYGFLVREMTPYPNQGSNRRLLPGFALYGQDPNNSDATPILAEMIRESNAEAKDYTLHHVIFPIIEAWVDGFRSLGFVFELHGQNTLLEIDEENNVSRVVMRDSTSIVIDKARREELELPMKEFTYNVLEDSREETLSLRFDYFMGHHFLDYIARVLEDHFGVSPEELHSATKKRFKDIFPHHKNYLPRTMIQYSDQRGSDGSVVKIDSKKAPRWRP